MARKDNQATWNREDRDLLVELSTRMQVMQTEMTKVYAEIKDINSGFTARLTNVEVNSVSKIELKQTDEHVEELEKRLRTLEDTGNQWLGKTDIIGWSISAIIALAVAVLGAGKF